MRPARTLSPAAVAVLQAIAAGVRHGFDIMDSTGLPSGTVYPALGRLERDGYLRSEWEDAAIARHEKRPSRRYYRVTASGVRFLNGELARYRRLRPVAVQARGGA